MRSNAARQALVALLILATAAAGLAFRSQGQAAPALPRVEAVAAATQWQVVQASGPSRWGILFRQWVLRDAAGHEALLYLGVTSQVQAMVRWDGELGYLGEGYVVVGRRDAQVALADGRRAPVVETTLRHLSQVRLVRYAIVGPGVIARHGPELAAGAAWDTVRGAPDGYYLVRVSVDGSQPGAGEAAAGLLSAVLADLADRAG